MNCLGVAFVYFNHSQLLQTTTRQKHLLYQVISTLNHKAETLYLEDISNHCQRSTSHCQTLNHKAKRGGNLML